MENNTEALLNEIKLLKEKIAAIENAGKVKEQIAVEQGKIHENLLLKETAVENAVNAISLLDVNGYYIYANPAFKRLYNISQEKDLIGRHFSEVSYFVDFLRRTNQNLSEKKGLTIEEELSTTKKDGSIFHIRYLVSAVHDENGKFIGSVWSMEDITARRLAEEKVAKYQQELEQIIEERTQSLFASEEKFKTLYNKSSNMKMVLRADKNNFGCITSINDTALKQLGFMPEEMFGANISLICHPTLVNTLKRNYAVSNLSSQLMQTESVFRTSAGEFFPVEIDSTIISYDDEDSILLSARDITQKKKTMEQVRLFSRALEQTSSLLMILDLDGNIQNINKAFTDITGYTLEEVYGKSPREILTDTMTDEERTAMQNTISSGSSWKGEFLNRKKNGDMLWMSATIAPVRNNMGEIIYSVAIEEDITDKKKQEYELKKLSQVIEISQVSIIITNSDFKIEYANPYTLARSGFTLDELIGTEPKLINSKYYPTRYHEEIKEILMSGETWHGDLQNETNDGEIYWEQSSITPVVNEKGVIVNFAGIHTDITELKKTQAELVIAKEQADAAAKAKSTFLANMSHEIRTPMNAVLGYSELLGRVLKDPVQKNYLESILLSGKNLLSLINDVLDLSKIEAGKIELHYTNVDARTFFDEFKKLFALTVANKKLDFIVDFSSGFPNTIKIDDVRLRQILLNIIGNAVKFTHKGYVKLTVFEDNIDLNEETKDTTLELNVIIEDTGIGMTKEFLTNIFQPFLQASRSYGGTGLGLSITNKLIQAMGGNIIVKSEPDQGSSFHIVIPNVKFQQEIVETVSYETADSESATFSNLKLVVVDDIQHNRTLVTDALSDRGIELFEAENGELGLELISKVRPDIVISDLRMPVMDGFKLLEAIRKDPELEKTTVIVYSASVTEKEREKIERHDFDGSLMKPLIIKNLFNLLAQKFPDRMIKTEPTTNNTDIEPIIENITDIDGLLDTFENELTAIWSTFREKQPLKEIKTFAEQLIQTGEKHNSNALKQYGEKLKMAATNFNVKGIITDINNFPELIQQHKKLKK